MITDILIDPVGTKFDVAEVGSFLEAQPHTARDKIRAEMFMISESDDELDEARQARVADTIRFPTTVILVEVRAERIKIAYRTVHASPAKRFVEWLQSQYQVRFLDDEFNDVTDEARDLDFLFGSE